ncbi:MAG: cytochrome c biogenesis protein CcdA, partial [Dehalococcoidia bacterium]|nr:cytochrome c biogenesis protein CcdA [Dehalococcoidia bacterium]
MNEFPGMLILPFVGGVISFLSPCVLPLVPAYLSFVSGLSAEEVLVRGARKRRQTERMVFSLLLFIMGFSIIFVLLGASASLVGGFLLEQKVLLSRVSGVLIILMGLFFMGFLPIPWLNMENRPFLTSNSESPTGALSNIVVGMAFGFGWTPCIGPILSSILLYASTTSTVGLGMALLSAYAVGLGVPF